ncbi:MAG: SH3 domain-containing protein [Pseudomonadota bacterium]
MSRLTIHLFRLLLLVLLPLAVHATPPPYWPGYPPMPAAPINRGDAFSPVITGEKALTTEISSDIDERQKIATSIQQGNFAEAYYLWRPRADSGDADAQYGIGWMYHNGYGLAINDDKAIAWWELASSQGHTDATFALGMLYGLGEGPVRRDMELAISYYHQAARDGHQDARLLLRTLIAEGNDDARQLMQTLLNEKRLEEIGIATTIQPAKANVRKGPGTKHKVLTTLLQGHVLLPLKREGRWLLMGIEGKTFTGWIHDSLIGKDILSNS